jgi:hypothetical protein
MFIFLRNGRLATVFQRKGDDLSSFQTFSISLRVPFVLLYLHFLYFSSKIPSIQTAPKKDKRKTNPNSVGGPFLHYSGPGHRMHRQPRPTPPLTTRTRRRSRPDPLPYIETLARNPGLPTPYRRRHGQEAEARAQIGGSRQAG